MVTFTDWEHSKGNTFGEFGLGYVECEVPGSSPSGDISSSLNLSVVRVCGGFGEKRSPLYSVSFFASWATRARLLVLWVPESTGN